MVFSKIKWFIDLTSHLSVQNKLLLYKAIKSIWNPVAGKIFFQILFKSNIRFLFAKKKKKNMLSLIVSDEAEFSSEKVKIIDSQYLTTIMRYSK